MSELTKADKEAWDHLIDMDKRCGYSYTLAVLQELIGEDTFRELYIKQAKFTSLSSHAKSEDGSFQVCHTVA